MIRQRTYGLHSNGRPWQLKIIPDEIHIKITKFKGQRGKLLVHPFNPTELREIIQTCGFPADWKQACPIAGKTKTKDSGKDYIPESDHNQAPGLNHVEELSYSANDQVFVLKGSVFERALVYSWHSSAKHRIIPAKDYYAMIVSLPKTTSTPEEKKVAMDAWKVFFGCVSSISKTRVQACVICHRYFAKGLTKTNSLNICMACLDLYVDNRVRQETDAIVDEMSGYAAGLCTEEERNVVAEVAMGKKKRKLK